MQKVVLDHQHGTLTLQQSNSINGTLSTSKYFPRLHRSLHYANYRILILSFPDLSISQQFYMTQSQCCGTKERFWDALW